jgi:hypothetical protein
MMFPSRHWPDQECACHARDGHCLHQKSARFYGVDSQGVSYSQCADCTELWTGFRLPADEAELMRRAIRARGSE